MFTPAHRLIDRVRPWAAATPPPGAREVAVIGAGPAGLATAALLRRAGVRAIVFDRGGAVGGSWPGRYDSLRLNTVRWMSDLPGFRIARANGRWVRRDDLVSYFERYAEHHRLEFQFGAEVERVDTEDHGWQLRIGSGSRRFDGVVLATGHARTPVMPSWSGADEFTGRLIHAAAYLRPDDHSGRVLVVGAGSSGGEICVDLANAGLDVTWSVRSTRRVFPREVFGVPATPFAPPADALPDRTLDRLAPWVERRIYGRRDYLPEPTTPMMQLLAVCKEPMTADGVVELVRTGRIRVVEAVTALDRTGAALADGTHAEADCVIAATGYRAGLEPLVGHLGVRDGNGRPTDVLPLPGLGFVGFRIPFTGTLWAIEHDARRVAAALAVPSR
jgi:putative flavoprotein involved in K+ transport